MRLGINVSWNDGEVTKCVLDIESISYYNNYMNIYLYGDYDYYLKAEISKPYFDNIASYLLADGYCQAFNITAKETDFDIEEA